MRRGLDLLLVTLVAGLMVGWLALRVHAPAPSEVPLSAAGLLGSAPEDFRRVTGPQPLEFPADHAMHPGYRNEWWYFTGNLEAEDGRRLGWQFTLFRFALDPAERPDSEFAAEAVWMAHMAVSDGAAERFFSHQRFARGALDLAGATSTAWWLKDWQVRATESGWHLQASAPDFRVELALDPVRPVVLQGDAGYSRKGPEPGNASRYYSMTRIDTRGRVELAGEPLTVRGLSWLDREWGSSQLGEGLAGWDWFALQFDDGRDLMVYRLRRDDGSVSEFSAGILVQPDGHSEVLGAEAFHTREQRRWRDADGVQWPVEWRVRVPEAGIDVLVRPLFDAQRWRGAVDYWEGAVEVLEKESRDRIGRGYLELSGYAG